MTTATFTNGTTISYGGKRDVRAAWRLSGEYGGVDLTGLTGFSVDLETARKTAEKKITEQFGTFYGLRVVKAHLRYGATPQRLAWLAERLGCKADRRSVLEAAKAADLAAAAARDAAKAAIRVEAVPVDA